MELKFIVESILFSAQKPLTPKEVREVLKDAANHSEDETVAKLKKIPLDQISSALEELAQEHEAAQRSFRLICVAGAWQFVSQPAFAPWLKALVGHKARPPRLSQPALETMAIIAYRQPLTRSDMEQIRGVAVDGVLGTLIDRGLVEQKGRMEVAGRPMTFGTTPLFLEYFGLKSLEDLPDATELRKIPIEKPEGLLTVDPELETAPEDGESQSPNSTPHGSGNGQAARKANPEDAPDESSKPNAQANSDSSAADSDDASHEPNPKATSSSTS